MIRSSDKIEVTIIVDGKEFKEVMTRAKLNTMRRAKLKGIKIVDQRTLDPAWLTKKKK